MPVEIKERELAGFERGKPAIKGRKKDRKRRTTHDGLLLLLSDVFVNVIGITGTGIFEPIHGVAHDV